MIRRRDKDSGNGSNGAKPFDASKAWLSLPIVAVVVVSCLTTAGTQWAIQRGNETRQAAQQSDIRDILTRMQQQENRETERVVSQKQVAELQAKLIEKDAAAVRASVNELRIQVDGFKTDLAKMQEQVSGLREMVLQKGR